SGALLGGLGLTRVRRSQGRTSLASALLGSDAGADGRHLQPERLADVHERERPASVVRHESALLRRTGGGSGHLSVGPILRWRLAEALLTTRAVGGTKCDRAHRPFERKSSRRYIPPMVF